MRSTTWFTAILSFAIAVTLASVSAQTPPPSGAPIRTDKQAISKACSDQANAKGLHGKARKHFMSSCKHGD